MCSKNHSWVKGWVIGDWFKKLQAFNGAIVPHLPQGRWGMIAPLKAWSFFNHTLLLNFWPENGSLNITQLSRQPRNSCFWFLSSWSVDCELRVTIISSTAVEENPSTTSIPWVCVRYNNDLNFHPCHFTLQHGGWGRHMPVGFSPLLMLLFRLACLHVMSAI